MKKNKPAQRVKFNSVDEVVDFLPEDQQEVFNLLREIMFSCDENIKEKLSFNTPFYKKNKGVCFIWPGAIDWGGKQFEGVSFGLNYGVEFLPDDGYWKKGKRKCVADKLFRSVDEIDVDLLRSYIYDALEYDLETKK